MNPIEAPPATDEPWSDSYSMHKALIGHAFAAVGKSLDAREAGDEAQARLLLADAEAMWRAADRIVITMTMQDDEVLVVSDPAVYAARYGIANENPTAVSGLLELVTQKLNEEEAHFGSNS